MLTVSGIGVITNDLEITEKAYNDTYYITMCIVCKDPYKEDARSFIKLTVRVPQEFIGEARKELVIGQVIQIRIGELIGFKNNFSGISMSVNTRYKWIEILKAAPTKSREHSQYSDV